MGSTDVGTALKRPAIARAKTANTSHVRSMTKKKKHKSRTGIYNGGSDVCNGPSLLFQAYCKCAKIMHSSHENGSQNYPDKSRKPAPVGGNTRSDNRRSTGNGSKMMPEHNMSLCRDKINAIFKFMGRGDKILIQSVYFI